MVKNLPMMWETQVWSLGHKDSLEKEMATHSSILAWKIPWTEEFGRLPSMGSQRVRHGWATNTNYTQKTVCVHSLFVIYVFPRLISFPPQHIRCPMLLVNLVPVIFRAFSAIFSHFLETHGKYTNCLLWNEARRICWDCGLVTNVDRPQTPSYSVLLPHLVFGISVRYIPSCPIYGYLAYLS